MGMMPDIFYMIIISILARDFETATDLATKLEDEEQLKTLAGLGAALNEIAQCCLVNLHQKQYIEEQAAKAVVIT